MRNCHATPKDLIIIYKQHSGLTLSLVRLQCFHQVGTFECVQTNRQEFQSCGQQFEQCQICWGSKASGFNRQSEHNPPELGCFITNKLLNWQKGKQNNTHQWDHAEQQAKVCSSRVQVTWHFEGTAKLFQAAEWTWYLQTSHWFSTT